MQDSSNNSQSRKKSSRALVFWAIGIFVALTIFLVIPIEFIFSWHARPLVEPPPPQYSGENASSTDLLNFLTADFKIINNVKALPRPVLQLFTEPGSSRLTIANPEKDFQATDVIYDSSHPRKRLIFAGAAQDRSFVTYEQGGFAPSHGLALFKLRSSKEVEPYWLGDCGSAASLPELRSRIANNSCRPLLPTSAAGLMDSSSHDDRAAESGPVGSEARGQQLIRLLKLNVLPKESGYLGIIGVSTQKVNVDGRTLAVQSQNYYLLTRDKPINYLHQLVPDDTHILIEGGPVDYFIFHPDGRADKIALGMNLAAGERPVVAVPGGCWKALRLRDRAAYALMANALSPEFTPDRVKIGEGAEWVKRFVNSAPWATPDALREFIGPNFQK